MNAGVFELWFVMFGGVLRWINLLYFNFVMMRCELAFGAWSLSFFLCSFLRFVLFMGAVVCHVKMLSTRVSSGIVIGLYNDLSKQ